MALLSDLVGIDSVNPALVADAAGEARIVDYLRSRLEPSGFAVTVVPARRHADRPSLVAVPPGPSDWPIVVLNGHLDTVGVAGMVEPFTPRVDGDHLYGRGAADMKGGVAGMVFAAAYLVAEGAPIRECLAELRTAPDRASTEALDEVQALLEPDWHAEAELIAHRDGWRLDGSGPAADLAARLGAELGTGRIFDAPYWMEAPLWQQLCPTVVCGPGGGGLHAADEWVDLGQVRAFTDALLHVLPDWSGRDQSRTDDT